MSQNVEQYIATYGIQDHAANQLRQLQPEIQAQVIAGNLADARDPTAVLISRMKKALSGTLTQPGDWSCPQCGDHNFARNQTCRSCGFPKPAGAGAESMPQMTQGMTQAMTQALTQSPTFQSQWDQQGSAASGSLATASQADIFIEVNQIEPHVAQQFRELQPHLQTLVMDAGSLTDARDPTAVLKSRMAKAIQGILQPMKMMPGDWICSKCGEHNFARNAQCRKCGAFNTGSSQSAITMGGMGGMGAMGAMGSMGGMDGMGGMGGMGGMDSMGSMWDMMSQMFQGKGGGGAAGATLGATLKRPGDDALFDTVGAKMQRTSAPIDTAAMEQFLMSAGIEAHGMEKFRELPDDLKNLVMEAGSLSDARDPTAVLISRCSKAKAGTLKPAMMMPGDWNCPNCGDHNFARNSFCRSCGTANPVTNPIILEEAATSSIDPSEIDNFLTTNNIAEHACAIFRGLAPQLQKRVIEAGSFKVCRNPTAVLMSRMGKAQRGQLQAAKMMPGDWACPNCGDHNFARNLVCRACGTPNPAGFSQGPPGGGNPALGGMPGMAGSSTPNPGAFAAMQGMDGMAGFGGMPGMGMM
mmetsp:Transcript_113470/g.206441  ORF Transcript_113470/g.206441 Transcript_113470/m.206441 type:complete len:582 (-) Transcript_113470:261-2006(-)